MLEDIWNACIETLNAMKDTPDMFIYNPGLQRRVLEAKKVMNIREEEAIAYQERKHNESNR